jgi:tetratricopeptide (TPR) repeat protein
MKRLFLSLMICGIGLAAWGGCRGSQPDEGAAVLAEATRLVSQGQEAERTSYATAVEFYQEAVRTAQTLSSQSLTASLWNKLLRNEARIGSYTLAELQEQVLPQARQKAEAEKDPLACALLLTRRVHNTEEKAVLLADVAGTYANLGRPEKVQEIVRESGSAVYGLLSALFERSFSAGQDEAAWALVQALEEVEVKDWALHWVAHGQMEQGRLEDALRAVEHMEDAATKAEALLALAAKYADSDHLSFAQTAKKVDLLGQAHKLIETVGELAVKTALLGTLSRSYAAVGQYERALRIAEAVRPADLRVKTFIAIAQHYAESGQKDAAVALLQQAVQIGETVIDPAVRTGILREAARAYVTMGEDAAALRIANTFKDPLARADVVEATIHQYVAVGKHESALQLAQRTPDKEARGRALSVIARSYAAEGRHEEAKAVSTQIGQTLPAIARQHAAHGQCEEARQAAAVIPDSEARAVALAEVTARCFAGQGDAQGATVLAQALQAADANRAPLRKDQVRVKMARLLMEAKQYNPARQVAETLNDASMRTTIFADLARSLLATGDNEQGDAMLRQALRASQKIRSPRERVKILKNIARQISIQGRAAQALEAAALIEDPRTRATALGDIAVSVAENGRYEEAMRLAQAIQRTTDRSSALAAITRRALAEEQYALAHQCTLLIPFGVERERTLAALARRYVAMERHEEAVTLMSSLKPGPLRTQVMIEVANAYLTIGQEKQVMRLLGEMRDASARDEVLVNLARRYSAEGRQEKARQVASAIVGSGPRARVMRTLVQQETLNRTAIDSYIPGRRGFCRGGPAWPPTGGQPHRVAPTRGGEKCANLVMSDLERDAGAQADSSTPTQETLQARVRALAAAGQCESARQAAETDGDPIKRATLLAMATRVCFEIGRQEDGESLLHKTRETIKAIHDGADRTRAFVALAKELIAGGQLFLVLEVARQIEDQAARTETFAALARKSLEEGQLSQAERFVGAMTDPALRDELFAHLADHYLARENYDHAFASAERITEPDQRTTMGMKIARSELMLTTKSAEPEPSTLQTPIQSRKDRQGDQNDNDEIAALARRYAKRGQSARVGKLLALKDSSVAKAVLLAEIAQDYAAAGEKVQAEEAFRSALHEAVNLFQGADKEEALVRIGILYAASGLIPDEKTRTLLRAIIEDS